jgi:hypothetical protein
MDNEGRETMASACLNLLNVGGGTVNAQYSGDFSSLSLALLEDWVVHHFEALNMVTLRLPPHGVFCLMHPQIVSWEQEREDFEMMEGAD